MSHDVNLMYCLFISETDVFNKNMNLSIHYYCIVYAEIQMPPKPLTANCGVKVALKETHCLKHNVVEKISRDIKKNSFIKTNFTIM